MQAALLLLPDFALILLGTALARWVIVSDAFWSGVEKLMYYVLFPALLFNALTRTHIDFTAAAPLLAVGAIAMIGGMLIALPAKPIFQLSPVAFASRFQCAFRFNSYLGIAVAGKLYGEPGVAAMGIVCGAMVPLANAASIGMLARHGTTNLWRELATNPMILSTLAGLLWNISGLLLPEPAQQFVERLSEATISLGLLTVGAALKLRIAVRGLPSEVYFLATKLLALPLIAWCVGRWIGLSGMYFSIAVAFAALPTGSAAYIITTRLHGDGPGVAWLISMSTLGAMITLPLWLAFT